LPPGFREHCARSNMRASGVRAATIPTNWGGTSAARARIWALLLRPQPSHISPTAGEACSCVPRPLADLASMERRIFCGRGCPLKAAFIKGFFAIYSTFYWHNRFTTTRLDFLLRADEVLFVCNRHRIERGNSLFCFKCGRFHAQPDDFNDWSAMCNASLKLPAVETSADLGQHPRHLRRFSVHYGMRPRCKGSRRGRRNPSPQQAQPYQKLHKRMGRTIASLVGHPFSSACCANGIGSHSGDQYLTASTIESAGGSVQGGRVKMALR